MEAETLRKITLISFIYFCCHSVGVQMVDLFGQHSSNTRGWYTEFDLHKLGGAK